MDEIPQNRQSSSILTEPFLPAERRRHYRPHCCPCCPNQNTRSTPLCRRHLQGWMTKICPLAYWGTLLRKWWAAHPAGPGCAALAPWVAASRCIRPWCRVPRPPAPSATAGTYLRCTVAAVLEVPCVHRFHIKPVRLWVAVPSECTTNAAVGVTSSTAEFGDPAVHEARSPRSRGCRGWDGRARMSRSAR